jgi:hypothetical protein
MGLAYYWITHGLRRSELSRTRRGPGPGLGVAQRARTTHIMGRYSIILCATRWTLSPLCDVHLGGVPSRRTTLLSPLCDVHLGGVPSRRTTLLSARVEEPGRVPTTGSASSGCQSARPNLEWSTTDVNTPEMVIPTTHQ